MRYYLDTEFDGHNGQLLSLALVRQDGRSCYLMNTTIGAINDVWVQENVIPKLHQHDCPQSVGFPVNHFGLMVREFLADDPEITIVSDSPVDIGRFCQVISTGSDGTWEPTNYPYITFIVMNEDAYPCERYPQAVQHNAWWDAMALYAKLEPQFRLFDEER